jgi:hypothetical protein
MGSPITLPVARRREHRDSQYLGPETRRVLANVKASDLKGGLKVNDRVLGVRLADAVELVRSELEEARKRGASSSLAFVPGPVELEFEVVFDETAGADAGVRVWVVSLGAKGAVWPFPRSIGSQARPRRSLMRAIASGRCRWMSPWL